LPARQVFARQFLQVSSCTSTHRRGFHTRPQAPQTHRGGLTQRTEGSMGQYRVHVHVCRRLLPRGARTPPPPSAAAVRTAVEVCCVASFSSSQNGRAWFWGRAHIKYLQRSCSHRSDACPANVQPHIEPLMGQLTLLCRPRNTKSFSGLVKVAMFAEAPCRCCCISTSVL